MEYRIAERVLVDDAPGKIVARVRADDDPRKCVPTGEKLQLRGEIGPRDQTTFLVKLDGKKPLAWTHRKQVAPELPAPHALAPSRRSGVLDQVRELSTGTLSYLTGYRTYADLERVHREFIQHVIATEGNGVRYQNWIDAWRWFVNGAAQHLPSYGTLDALFTYVVADLPPDAAVARAPDGSWAVPMTARAASDESQIGRPPEGNLIRVGFVARHWLGPRDRARFLEWAAAAAT